MNGFTLLWGKILDSSLWRKESNETRLVWVTILAMKDSEGKIQSSVIGLADRARVSLEDCKLALKVLLAPDPDDTSKVEDGRRIVEIPNGWQVINHDLYRFSTDAKREFWRQQKAEQRAKENVARKRREKSNSDCSEKGFARPVVNAEKYRDEVCNESSEKLNDGV